MTRTLTVALLQLAAFDLADHEQAWAELLHRIDDAAADAPRLMVAPSTMDLLGVELEIAPEADRN